MARLAQRGQTKLKIQIGSTSGGGKTVSSLLLGYGLAGEDWSKVGLIDTENKSASLYANNHDLGIDNFWVEEISKYDPDSYINAIKELKKENVEVVIIDSTSHLWEETLGYKEKLGSEWRHWNTASQRFNRFRDYMLGVDLHIISTVRQKEKLAVEEIIDNDGNRKTTLVKLGIQDIQKPEFSYEYTLALNIDHKTHEATISKNRTPLFSNTPSFLVTKEHGVALREWVLGGSANGEMELQDFIVQIKTAKNIEELKDINSVLTKKSLSNNPDIMLALTETLKQFTDVKK